MTPLQAIEAEKNRAYEELCNWQEILGGVHTHEAKDLLSRIKAEHTALVNCYWVAKAA